MEKLYELCGTAQIHCNGMRTEVFICPTAGYCSKDKKKTLAFSLDRTDPSLITFDLVQPYFNQYPVAVFDITNQDFDLVIKAASTQQLIGLVVDDKGTVFDVIFPAKNMFLPDNEEQGILDDYPSESSVSDIFSGRRRTIEFQSVERNFLTDGPFGMAFCTILTILIWGALLSHPASR
jgi:hypothetical protein